MKAIRVVNYLEDREIEYFLNLERIDEIIILKDKIHNNECMSLYQGNKEALKICGSSKDYEKIKNKIFSHFNFEEIKIECGQEKQFKVKSGCIFEEKENKCKI